MSVHLVHNHSTYAPVCLAKSQTPLAWLPTNNFAVLFDVVDQPVSDAYLVAVIVDKNSNAKTTAVLTRKSGLQKGVVAVEILNRENPAETQKSIEIRVFGYCFVQYAVNGDTDTMEQIAMESLVRQAQTCNLQVLI
ncbi:MAG: hypothetical protein LBI39_01590 [Puniceicoccales bacterium]|nr:hypothetical protein [Puniceicoccales bacterium]